MRLARPLAPLVALVLAGGLALGACSDDAEEADDPATTVTTIETTTVPPTTGTTVAPPSTTVAPEPPTTATTAPPDGAGGGGGGGGGGAPATTIPYDPGQPCTLGTNPDCIDPEGTGQGVYLIGGADCVAAAQANGVSPEICIDLDGDGRAGYPDAG